MRKKDMRRVCSRLGASALATLCGGVVAHASSHREAPLITETPKVDGTDLYMFRSYEPGRENFVTLIAAYQPFQDPFGGPNYFTLDPDAVYDIHVENTGDAVEDITFRFRFKNEAKNIALNVGGSSVAVPVINVGPIGVSGNPNDTANLNVEESYTIEVIRGPRNSGNGQPIANAATGETTFKKPVDNIGQKTLPDYAAYAAAHIYDVNIPGCDMPGRVFVGQRKDPFVVSVGEIFDLVNIAVPIGAESSEADNLANKNVTALALEIPTSCLVGDDPVIGAWTSASVPSGKAMGTGNSSKSNANENARARQCKLGQRAGPGVAAGSPAGERAGHRLAGQGQIQRERAQGRCTVCELRDEPDIARDPGNAVQLGWRGRADAVSARGLGRDVPDRYRGHQPAGQREDGHAGRIHAAQHVSPATAGGVSEPARRHRRRCCRIPEWTAAGG